MDCSPAECKSPRKRGLWCTRRGYFAASGSCAAFGVGRTVGSHPCRYAKAPVKGGFGAPGGDTSPQAARAPPSASGERWVLTPAKCKSPRKRGLWCTRRGSNPQPSASEADTLSNCATSAWWYKIVVRGVSTTFIGDRHPRGVPSVGLRAGLTAVRLRHECMVI